MGRKPKGKLSNGPTNLGQARSPTTKSEMGPMMTTLVEPDGKTRRKSSMLWERKYGKGMRGWYDGDNRTKSKGGPEWVNGESAGEEG